MISSQKTVDLLAGRIQRAYQRRHPRWQPAGLTPGVWNAAASRLLDILKVDPAGPIDPELFVAIQPGRDPLRDPWAELTQQQSSRRYIRAVRKIVAQLRRELHGEVCRAEHRLVRGLALERVLATVGPQISPLARYILAHRAGRPDLSESYRAAAEGQHRACPLYRLASRSFLPAEAYPIASVASDIELEEWDSPTFSKN